MTQIHPVILCGGSGTRLWPSSRRSYPKQFIALYGEESLYQMTLRRFSGPGFREPIIMTNDMFRFIATEQCQKVGIEDPKVFVEPEARNTAPAILTAAISLSDTPDEMMLVTPSDQVLNGTEKLSTAVNQGVEAAHSGALVTFGIAPSYPETGYGYLKLGDDGPSLSGTRKVMKFVEKPCLADAETYIESGQFLWNSGMFLFRVGDVLQAFEDHAPDLMAPCKSAVENSDQDLGFTRLEQGAYARVRDVSFDYAIMEHAKAVQAVSLDTTWSDLGNWQSLWQVSDKDTSQVATQGNALAIDCESSLLRSESDSVQIVGVGLKNIVAVALNDAVLVANLDCAQSVKHAVTALREMQVEQADTHPQFHRPWGWYETLCLGERFRVKRIVVKPGGTLSLQSHLHRSEHWVVVSGTAEVVIGNDQQLVAENQSVYIPLGVKHRLSNPGQLSVQLIEVQTGGYLGEDDITRYEDAYNRHACE